MCIRDPKETKGINEDILEQKMHLYEYFKRTGVFSERVLKAYLNVPREEFVPKNYKRYAYVDEPLPIGKDATISAISMSLLLCEYANLKPGDKVLEIGTGSGYQAALISEIVCDRNTNRMNHEKPVKSIEINEEVYRFAIANLNRTCYSECVDVLLGDGTLGWPKGNLKFDAIIVTAAGEDIPEPLIKQLKVGGVLIMPLGKGFFQKLIRLKKLSEDSTKVEYLEDVRFVFLKGRYGVKNYDDLF